MRERTVCICILWTHNVFAYSQPTLLLIAVFGTSTVCVQVSRKRRKIVKSRGNSEEGARGGVHCTAILMKAMHVIRQLQKPLIPSCKLAKAEINVSWHSRHKRKLCKLNWPDPIEHCPRYTTPLGAIIHWTFRDNILCAASIRASVQIRADLNGAPGSKRHLSGFMGGRLWGKTTKKPNRLYS